MADKTNYSFAIIALVAIVAIVAVISLVIMFREAGVEPTTILIDDEGNIIGEAKGEKGKSAIKTCASFCKKYPGNQCTDCCSNYLGPEVAYQICYGKDWKIGN